MDYDWHPWFGFLGSPVPAGTPIEYRTKAGFKDYTTCTPEYLIWKHRASAGDIIQWRRIDTSILNEPANAFYYRFLQLMENLIQQFENSGEGSPRKRAAAYELANMTPKLLDILRTYHMQLDKINQEIEKAKSS